MQLTWKQKLHSILEYCEIVIVVKISDWEQPLLLILSLWNILHRLHWELLIDVHFQIWTFLNNLTHEPGALHPQFYKAAFWDDHETLTSFSWSAKDRGEKNQNKKPPTQQN